MDTVFVIFLAGCSHDLSLCEPVDTWQITAADQAACERVLEQKLMDTTAFWPVFHGSCEPVHADAAVVAPAWFVKPTDEHIS